MQMSKYIVALGLALLIAPAWAKTYKSPAGVVADIAKDRAYVLEEFGDLCVVDISTMKVERRIAVPAKCTGIAMSPDGANAYVTVGTPNGSVVAINVSAGTQMMTMPAGHTPMFPVISADGARLYVCNRFSNDISILDTCTGAELSRVPVLREPVAAALTLDGKKLYVSNFLPVGPSNDDVSASAISVIDTGGTEGSRFAKVIGMIELPNGATGLRGICMSPDGKFAYAVHILARYQMPTTQLERGWMNTNALSVISVADDKPVNTVLLDDVELGAANPWAAACTADGKYLAVAHAGTHEVSVIDRAALHERLEKAAAGERVNEVTASAADVVNDLSFLVGLRRRVALPGNGPRAITLAGTKALVAEYFSDSVSAFDVADQKHAVATLRLGPEVAQSAERRGEMLFHDALMCFQQWQSCISCHPDARADAINWDLLNDGIGNGKNTKSMLLSHQTPPVMSLGVRDKAETAVRAGMKFIQFIVRPEEDAAALDAYLKSLKPVPSPRLVDGKLSKPAERGKKVFENAGCASCHSGPLYTSLQKYDLGTGTDLDAGKPFDTPSLIEVWRTAPYLHDGRAGDMLELFKKYNPGDKHGKTSNLSDQDLKDLVEFILSL